MAFVEHFIETPSMEIQTWANLTLASRMQHALYPV